MTRLIDADELKHHKFVGSVIANGVYQQGWNDAIDAIIDNALTVEYPFTHVTVEHPVFGDKKFDGWIDKQRHLLFVDPITFEGAKALGWKWEVELNE